MTGTHETYDREGGGRGGGGDEGQCCEAGAALFGWNRSREKGAAPAPAPALTCVERKEIKKNLNNNVK